MKMGTEYDVFEALSKGLSVELERQWLIFL